MEEEIEIKLPKLGESIVSATVVQWFKKVGDRVKLDEPLLEVSTDKVNSEIPSPVSGTLKAILASCDEELEIGAPLALITTTENVLPTVEKNQEEQIEEKPSRSMKGMFTPVVLNLARDKEISLEELEQVPASGAGGRLSKRDLELYLKKRKTSALAPQLEETEQVKMTPMRKIIAENMVRSINEIPHATLINEVDMTESMKTIAREKEGFFQAHGYKLSVTGLIIKAISRGVQDYPLVNASLQGDTIIVKRCVNLGIAVSVDQGLLVPVIQNCQALSIGEIAREVASFSEKAQKTGALTPDQFKEGTITMTNFGMSGVLMGIPIIRHPEVAIVGVGAIRKQVVALEGDSIAIRSMMHLSLTFDHRVLDGMYGCAFLCAVKKHLEEAVEID